MGEPLQDLREIATLVCLRERNRMAGNYGAADFQHSLLASVDIPIDDTSHFFRVEFADGYLYPRTPTFAELNEATTILPEAYYNDISSPHHVSVHNERSSTAPPTGSAPNLTHRFAPPRRPSHNVCALCGFQDHVASDCALFHELPPAEERREVYRAMASYTAAGICIVATFDGCCSYP